MAGAERWAIVASLLATVMTSNRSRDVLERMSDGHPMSRLDQLLPWNWTRLKVAA